MKSCKYIPGNICIIADEGDICDDNCAYIINYKEEEEDDDNE